MDKTEMIQRMKGRTSEQKKLLNIFMEMEAAYLFYLLA